MERQLLAMGIRYRKRPFDTRSVTELRKLGGMTALLRKLSDLRDSLARRRGAQLLSYALAALIFGGGGWVALANVDRNLTQLSVTPLLLLALIVVPATLAANALEYALSAAITGHRVGVVHALRVSLYATAANLFPVPGSAIVRVVALKRQGAGTGGAISSTAALGLIWLALSALGAGAWSVHAAGLEPTPIALTVAGIAMLTVALVLLRRYVPASRRMTMTVLALLVTAAKITVAAVGLMLAFRAIGFAGTIGQGYVITLSGALASAAGIFPGGLGLREVLASFLAPLVGVDGSLAFLAVALERLVGMGVYAVVSLGIPTFTFRRESPDPSPSGDS